MFAYVVSQLSWLTALIAIGCHLALAADDIPLAARVFGAVPALIIIVEARAYLRKESNELPFILFAMLQFYVFFGFPVFVETRFFDLTGPVLFTDAMRNAAGLAVALGALSLWAGGRAGFRWGRRFASFAEKAMPPAEPPSGRWDMVFYIFAGVSVLVNIVSAFAPSLIPSQIGQAVGVIFQLEFAIGLAIVRGPRSLGRRSDEALLVFGGLIGMARGMLNPIVRSGMAYIAGRWARARRLPIVAIGVMIALFAVLQPAKQAYREQIWSEEARTGQSTNVSQRVTAWQNVFTNAPSQYEVRGQPEESKLSRLCELDPLINAMQVVPQRVPFIYGKSLLEVVYAPIPRLIWPNKPTTIDSITQHYAVIFGIQTERGAESTAIGMNMLVEGYWNFGWFGIVLLCLAAGLVVGASQSVFSGKHWALCAIGIAQISTLNIPSTVVVAYSSLFQFAVGRLIAVWGIYWLARVLGSRTKGVRGAVTQRLARR